MSKVNEKRRPTPAVIIAAVIIGLALLFGIVFGTVAIVRSATSLVLYKNVGLDGGVVNYLASTYKQDYLTYLRRDLGITEAADTAEFWSTKSTLGEGSFGEAMTEFVSEKIKRVAVGAYLFDRYSRLTKAERDMIDAAAADVLAREGASERAFNEAAAKYGFKYDDMRRAARLIYKMNTALSVIFGEGGYNLAGGGYTAELEEFLASYSRVKLLYISTEKGYKRNDKGEYEEYSLSAEEREAALGQIAEVRELIAAVGTGDRQMSSVMFDSLIDEHPFNLSYDDTGFYLSPASAYTEGFATAEDGRYASVVSTALSLSVGEFGEADIPGGVCFIYRIENETGAYVYSLYSDFFDDFYADAAEYLYDKALSESISGVKIKKKFREIDFYSIPCNWSLAVKI
ncbi:MAG: hypothetical protein IKA64_01635 [Clostridia bacterium]|nr:hypothetical protein [Clostridia bacterium]